MSDFRSRGCEFEPQLGHIIFMEIDHEIISTDILTLPLIRKGRLSVTGKEMCTRYWYTTLIGGPRLPWNLVSRITDWLNMTLIVLTVLTGDVKPHTL